MPSAMRSAVQRSWFRHLLSGVVLCFAVLVSGVGNSREPLFLGVTTSTENSGLLGHLIEAFAADHDIEIRAVTAGTGAVLNLAARGDVDLILVHSPGDEKAFVEAGYGIDRRPVMQNRFVIVGPNADPAGVRAAKRAGDAFAAIATHEALFLSRGDESGTHQAERGIWQAIGLDPAGSGPGWYRESGSGQGATLNIAANTGAYVLTDEATWTTFGNPGDLEVLLAGDDPALDNFYSVIRVNPERHPGLNAEAALTFADWLTSKAGQAVIESFKVDGRSLFQPISDLSG
ncbi:MAG: substrate-binding domain-containing protein [Alphaproteobacteria bacterium]